MAKNKNYVVNVSSSEFKALLEIQQQSLAEISALKELTELSQLLQIGQDVEAVKTEKDMRDEIKESKETNKNLKELIELTKESSKNIAKIVIENEPKTASEAAKENFENKFGSLRNVLDTMGIVKKGSGGFVDAALTRREQDKNFIKGEMKLNGTTEQEARNKLIEVKEQRKIVSTNEKEIQKFTKLGISEEQLAKTAEGKKLLSTREESTAKLATIDYRVQEMDAARAKAATEFNAPAEPTPTPTPAKAAITPSFSNQLIGKVKYNVPFAEKMAMGNTPISAIADTKIQPLKTDENQQEAIKREEDQTELLKLIAENTGGATKAKQVEKKPETTAEGGGFLDTIMSMLGGGLMNAFKVLFNPRLLLKAFTKFFVPAAIIGSLVNGIMDGFKEFTETGDIGKALIAGLGGVLSFLTFGLIDKETVAKVVDAVGGFVNQYIIEPVMKFASFIGDTFKKYIADPLSEVFKPVTEFFKGMAASIIGMLQNISIPEISFTIPVINKKVSVGPFYPFGQAETKQIPAGNSDAGAGQGSSDFAATDPRRVDLAKPLKNGELETPGSISKGLADMVAADKAAANAMAPSVSSGNIVAGKSTEVSGAKEDLVSKSSGNTAVVNAPTTVNNTTNQSNIMRSPYRNEEGSYNKYIGSRYAAY